MFREAPSRVRELQAYVHKPYLVPQTKTPGELRTEMCFSGRDAKYFCHIIGLCKEKKTLLWKLLYEEKKIHKVPFLLEVHDTE